MRSFPGLAAAKASSRPFRNELRIPLDPIPSYQRGSLMTCRWRKLDSGDHAKEDFADGMVEEIILW